MHIEVNTTTLIFEKRKVFIVKSIGEETGDKLNSVSLIQGLGKF